MRDFRVKPDLQTDLEPVGSQLPDPCVVGLEQGILISAADSKRIVRNVLGIVHRPSDAGGFVSVKARAPLSFVGHIYLKTCHRSIAAGS